MSGNYIRYPATSGGGGGNNYKASVVVATTANGTFATAFDNASSVDGVTLATGDRILIKNQTDATQNGIYIVQASGVPLRSTDANTWDELVDAMVPVQQGTGNADTLWLCTVNPGGTLGVTNVTFTSFPNLTASRAVVTSSTGQLAAATTTATEIGYVNGVTSSIQTQINAKLTTLQADNYRLMATNGSATIAEVAAITASRALKSDANGIPVHFDTSTEPTLTELSYVKGVTSALQTQLDGKVANNVIAPVAINTVTISSNYPTFSDVTGLVCNFTTTRANQRVVFMLICSAQAGAATTFMDVAYNIDGGSDIALLPSSISSTGFANFSCPIPVIVATATTHSIQIRAAKLGTNITILGAVANPEAQSTILPVLL